MRLFYLVLDHLHEEETTTRCSMTHLKAEYVLFVLVSASAFFSSCRSNVPSLTNLHASQLKYNIHIFIPQFSVLHVAFRNWLQPPPLHEKNFLWICLLSLCRPLGGAFTTSQLSGLSPQIIQITLYGHDWPLLLMALLGWPMDVFKCLLVFLFNNVTWAFQNVIHIFVVTSDCPSDLILLSCLRTTCQTLSLHYNQHTAPADGVWGILYILVYTEMLLCMSQYALGFLIVLSSGETQKHRSGWGPKIWHAAIEIQNTILNTAITHRNSGMFTNVSERQT